jgi:cytoskeletal protein RodZ
MAKSDCISITYIVYLTCQINITEGKMEQNKTKISKNARREMAIKKAKRKRLIIVTVAGVLALALITVITISAIREARTETYTDGSQSVKLLPDGSFSATISHGDLYNGTYTKTDQEGLTVVTYSTDSGSTASGVIIEGQLYIPEEWLDDHGHNTVLPLK